MYCHGLEGNRHPLLTLCTTCPSCLLTADLNDAAGGILSSALGLSTCHFKARCRGFRFECEKNISRCACSLAEWNQSVLLLTERHDWALRHVLLVWLCARCKRTANCLWDFHTATWLNQMLFGSFCHPSSGQIWLCAVLLNGCSAMLAYEEHHKHRRGSRWGCY